jgi:RimJ/RimL family protein N-acetyltransferase
MKVCLEQKPEYLDFVIKNLGKSYSAEGKKFIASVDGDKVLAVIMYSRMTDRDCEITIVTDGEKKWCSRSLIRACFEYPFKQLGMARCMVITGAWNEKAISLASSFGFVKEGVLREYFPDSDGILMAMLRHECRWIER